jgi:hypothetical protein
MLTACSSHVDHILLGAPSLAEGIAVFERATGVTAKHGGRHASGGTENALVNIGPHTYLEIIAPHADAQPSDALAMQLKALKTPQLIGFAVRVDDAAKAHADITRQGFKLSPPKSGGRVTPAGDRLDWITFAVEEPKLDTAPFFIEWSAATKHPSQSSPGGCTMERFTIADPHASDLEKLLDAVQVHVPVTNAQKPAMQLTLQCPKGQVAFTSD